MSIARFATRSLNNVTFLRPFRPIVSRSLATNANEDPNQNRSSFDSSDNLDSLFGDYTGNDEKSNDFFQHLSKAEKDKRDFNGYNRSGGSRYSGGGSMSKDETVDPSSDGVDGKLKEAALAYNMDEGDGFKEYSFRPDFNNSWGMNNFPRMQKQMQNPRQNNNKSEVTTEEVLKNADFRNVRFLANFITEAGIIIKRKQTGISAKAQRKIAREIKTARAFGLMPFTTMGTKAFQFGKTMENRDQDFEYEVLDDDDEFDEGNA
ncbi:Ribosomal protein S18 [Arabidopsis suecica]|uniref:Ribosomal protein S18 n=1 Tax=Arabidopsis suecica TaxID=45249 RepID=A0A8T2CM92_ARASU|nr:Ribosomal protein S18 [Arabidopsis suecica]